MGFGGMREVGGHGFLGMEKGRLAGGLGFEGTRMGMISEDS